MHTSRDRVVDIKTSGCIHVFIAERSCAVASSDTIHIQSGRGPCALIKTWRSEAIAQAVRLI